MVSQEEPARRSSRRKRGEDPDAEISTAPAPKKTKTSALEQKHSLPSKKKGSKSIKKASKVRDDSVPQDDARDDVPVEEASQKKTLKPTTLPSTQIDTLATNVGSKQGRKSTPARSTAAQRIYTPQRDTFCLLPPEQQVDYRQISFQHPSMQFKGYDTDIFEFKKSVKVNVVSHRVLTRDIQLCESQGNCELLFFTDELIDLYSQWTYRGENYEEITKANEALKFLPMPSHFFTKIRDTKFDLKACSVVQGYLKHIGINIFHADCIDATNHDDGHYSKIFIMNAWKVIERVHYKEKLDSDPMPVILIANSFNGYGRGHDPSTVAKKIRRFLNQAEKFYGLGGGAAFNVNTMPHMVLNVPQQETGWTCGPHCMVLTHLMREFLKLNGPISYQNVTKVEEALHHNAEAPLLIRSDLLKLVTALQGKATGTIHQSPLDGSLDSDDGASPVSKKALGSKFDLLALGESDDEDDSILDGPPTFEGTRTTDGKQPQTRRHAALEESEDEDDSILDGPPTFKGTQTLDQENQAQGRMRAAQNPTPDRKQAPGRKRAAPNSKPKAAAKAKRSKKKEQKGPVYKPNKKEKETIQDRKNRNREKALSKRSQEKQRLEEAYFQAVKEAEEKKQEAEEKARLVAEARAAAKEKGVKLAGIYRDYNRRVQGQPASSVRQLKDQPLRSKAKVAFKSATSCSAMGSYDDEHMDKTCPRFRMVTIAMDEVVPQPSKAGGNLRRDEPVFSAAGPDDRAELDEFLDKIIANRKKIKHIRSQEEWDERHFGDRKPMVTRNAMENMDTLTDKRGNDDFKNAKSTQSRVTPARKAKEGRTVSVANHPLLGG